MCDAIAKQQAKKGQSEIAEQFTTMGVEFETVSSDGFWPQGVAFVPRRWPDSMPWTSSVDGTLWMAADPEAPWSLDMYEMMRKDAKFLLAYQMPPLVLETKVEVVKKKAVVEDVDPVVDAGRAGQVEMAIANLMMKYRDVMKQPGKSKTEREMDFILLIRDRFLGMESDIVMVEKHIGLLQGFYPVQGKFKKKDEWEEIDEPGVLFGEYPDYNIVINNTPNKNTPPLSERMLMTMSHIPSYQLRLTCCESMLFLSANLEDKVNSYCGQMDMFTESAQMILKNHSLNNILRGTCAMANFLNHIVKMPGRMNISDLSKCKSTVGFDVYDCYTNMTNYYGSKVWEDNNKENTIMYYVICFLVQKKEPKEGVDVKQLSALNDQLNKTLKNKVWNLESKTDEIEANINVLARAVGELKDFEDEFETIDGVKTLVSAEKRVLGSRIQGSKDNFEPHVRGFYNGVSKYVLQIKESRTKMSKAMFMVLNHLTKKDMSPDFTKGYFALPEDDYKMPGAERFMRMLLEVCKNSVTTYETTQRDSVLARGAASAGL